MQQIGPLLLALLAAISHVQVRAFCFYGNGGYTCGKKSAAVSALVVRPVDLPKFDAGVAKPAPFLKFLKPVGGLCSCKTTVCSPAIPAKPPAFYGVDLNSDVQTKLLQKLAMSQYGYGLASAHLQAPPPAPAPDPVPVPTDAVSLQLALKAQQQLTNAMEDRLSFGFRSIPKDVPVQQHESTRKLISTVPEENLFAMNGAVVALKPPTMIATAAKSVDEEAEETLLYETAREETFVGAIQKPTLGQLGFQPALIEATPTKTIERKFTADSIERKFTADFSSSASFSASCVGVPGAPSYACNDGSVPGQVFQGSVPKVEKYVFPAPPLPPCNELEETALGIPPPRPVLPPTFAVSGSSNVGYYR